jgi:hypothetical protein
MSSIKTLTSRPAGKVLLAAFVSSIFAFPVFGQSGVWTGSASCMATASGTYTENNGATGTFSYTETQAWAMTGGAPSPVPPNAWYPGTYTVTGSGFNQPSSGIRQSYSTSYSVARALLVGQLSGGRVSITPAQLSGSLQGTSINGTFYNIIELPFPVPTGTVIPLQGSSSPSMTTAIAAQEPGNIPTTVSCTWDFGPPKPGSRFVPLRPCRLIDTRNSSQGLTGRGFPPHFFFVGVMTIPVAGQCGIPASATVTAYSLNLTAVPNGPLNSLSIKPTGQSSPALALLSAPDGDPTANAAIVPALPSGSVDVTLSSSSNFIIDVDGYFDSSNGDSFYLLPSVCRAVDTRSASGPTAGAMLSGGVTRSFALQSSGCNIPADVQAYALSITAAPAGFFGGLTIWPTGQSEPTVSTLNAYDGQTKTNAALIQAGIAGEVSIFPYNNTHLSVDIIGYFAPAGAPGALTYNPLTSCQAASVSLTGLTSQNLTMQGTCGLPYWAAAYVLNFTATPSAPLTGLAAMPTGQTAPAYSILSAGDGQVTASNTITASSNGSITVVATAAAGVNVTAWGYFAQ